MLEKYKHLIATCFGVIGSCVANALGGWDSSMQTLLTFIVILLLGDCVAILLFYIIYTL